MAWNEPGGGRDRDPWGGKKGGEGPPDLDEALQKLKERFGGLFGGSGGNGGKGVSGALVGVVIGALLVIWGLMGFYQIDAKEQAVILRLGKFQEVKGPGLQWNPPVIDSVTKVLVTEEREYRSKGLMLTQDESIVSVPLTVQYNIKDSKDFVLNVKDPEVSLRHATESAIRHVVGSTTTSDVLSEGRSALAGETRSRLQEYLDNYQSGIYITQVNILEAEPPTQVKAAFDDVISAKENKDQYKNQAEAYSNEVIPKARGTAQRLIQEATAYRDRVIAEAEGQAQRFEKLLVEYQKAPEVTRQRLYIDTVQEVMGNSTKVMVDVEGGNNMLYLPLDRLVEAQPKPVINAPGGNLLDNPEILNLIDQIVQQRLREQNNSNRRGGR
ncbi:MAG: FtsH protease activity modulator HflK [Porticoccaceae bacterium]|nr:FtsH protease activity modulator HflK [Porticoccaceae bacterium]